MKNSTIQMSQESITGAKEVRLTYPLLAHKEILISNILGLRSRVLNENAMYI